MLGIMEKDFTLRMACECSPNARPFSSRHGKLRDGSVLPQLRFANLSSRSGERLRQGRRVTSAPDGITSGFSSSPKRLQSSSVAHKSAETQPRSNSISPSGFRLQFSLKPPRFFFNWWHDTSGGWGWRWHSNPSLNRWRLDLRLLSISTAISGS